MRKLFWKCGEMTTPTEARRINKKLHGFPWRFHEQPRASHDEGSLSEYDPLELSAP